MAAGSSRIGPHRHARTHSRQSPFTWFRPACGARCTQSAAWNVRPPWDLLPRPLTPGNPSASSGHEPTTGTESTKAQNRAGEKNNNSISISKAQKRVREASRTANRCRHEARRVSCMRHVPSPRPPCATSPFPSFRSRGRPSPQSRAQRSRHEPCVHHGCIAGGSHHDLRERCRPDKGFPSIWRSLSVANILEMALPEVGSAYRSISDAAV